jgi:HEAT repeat protein
MSTPTDIPFQKLLDALLDAETPLNPRFLYRLSDLEGADLKKLAAVWPQIPLWRRQALMEDVEELSEADTLLSFVTLCRLAASDEESSVRFLAVRTLWDYEETRLVSLFMDILQKDADAAVRSAAAGALGRFVYTGEVEEIPAAALRRIEDLLLRVLGGDDTPQVRHSALEALGYSSRAEIPPLIEAAYASKDKQWVASALFAMGCSGDEIWQPKVMAMLENTAPQLRCEAARAAGELEIADAVPTLLELLDDPDNNTRLASIWSLSQIGGEGVRQRLEALCEESEETEEIQMLEAALENLAFNEGVQLIPLYDFPSYQDEEFEDLEDLDDADDIEEGDLYAEEDEQDDEED